MPLQPGTRLGPYEIVGLLGAGGMGEVYRARDPRLGRDVALKVLPEEVTADPDRLRRFEHEARAAGALNHPNVLAVHDVGTEQGVPFMVAELLEGETLRESIRKAALTTERALDCATQIADGLAAAHAKGVIHRDLKPENVFITTEGRIKILDFGLAKLRREAPRAAATGESQTRTAETHPGTVLGTIGYMSPEQVRGEAVDHRTDIFAFGALLYEMLTGRQPFRRGSETETTHAILKDEPPELSAASGAFSPEVRRIVRRCLEKRPEDRYQSARDLALDLRSAAAGGVARRGKSLVVGALAAALLVAAAAAGVLVVHQRRQRAAATAEPRAGSPIAKSIAVLPFQNLSPDPENAYFADGMTEDILTQLAKIQGLKVIARTSVMRYKGTEKPIREIARELGVGVVLEGSVRRAGNRVRIVSQLIDAETEQHLWADTYDRDLADIFAIQSDVAQQIASALKTTLTPADKGRIAHRPTENIEAYDLYVRGREHYYRYRTEDNEQAIDLFRKALAIDPRFALAHAGLADAFSQRFGRFGGSLPDVEASVGAARKAVELDPQLAEAHKALALTAVSRGHIREALAENRRAVELLDGTGFAGVANVGNTLFYLGRFDEALPWLRRSAERDPTNAVTFGALGHIYDALGDSAPAEAALHKALEMHPTLGATYVGLMTLCLRHERRTEALEWARKAVGLIPDPYVLRMAGLTELVTGNEARARELLERALPALQGQRRSAIPDAAVETYLAWLYMRAGRRGEGKRLLSAASAADHRHLDSGNEYWSVPFDLACIQVIEGDKHAALRWLERAYDAGWRGWPQAGWSPLLDPLRGDERFQKLMARIEADVVDMRREAGLASGR